MEAERRKMNIGENVMVCINCFLVTAGIVGSMLTCSQCVQNRENQFNQTLRACVERGVSPLECHLLAIGP